jgi:tetratricopeptide (TPR) repeat protein
VSEGAREIQAEGATVLFGRTYEENLIPLQPLVQAIRHLVAYSTDAFLAAHVHRYGPHLGRLVPELAARLGDLPEATEADPETERYQLFEAVTGLVSAAAREAPVLLVLDDLHWADRSTLAVVAHLLRAADPAPVLVLGTYRDTEVDGDHPLARVLSELGREHRAERLLLAGLDGDDVAQLLAALSVRDAPATLVEIVHRDTGGNPLFISEVVHSLLETGGLREDQGEWTLAGEGELSVVPESVRAVLDRRLARLSPETSSLLVVAAVIGREFSLGLLAVVRSTDRETVLERLEEALAAKVIVELASGFGRYAFSHALVRQAVLGDLSATRRAMLHRQVALALQPMVDETDATSGTGDSEDIGTSELLGALAHNFLAAASLGAPEVDHAVRYTRQAAEAAMDLAAYDEAARLLEPLRGLHLKARVRGPVLVELGEAYRSSGRGDEARETFVAAMASARAVGDPDVLGQAVIGLAQGIRLGLGARWGYVDDELVAHLEDALAAVDRSDSLLRARLLSQLAMALFFTDDRDRLNRLCDEAEAMAHRIGDKGALAIALSARFAATWGTADVETRWAAAVEMMDLAEATGDREMILKGHLQLATANLERGEMTAGDDHIEAIARLAPQFHRPFHRWWVVQWHALRALQSGRLAAAEELINEAFVVGQEAHSHNATNSFGIQMVLLRMYQGRAGELEEVVRANIEQYPYLPGWRTGLILVGLGSGRPDVVREGYLALVADDFAIVPRDAMWPPTLVIVAWAADHLRDTATAARLYRDLLPLAGQHVTIGAGSVYLGAIDHVLGLLAATAGDSDAAVAHLEVAVADYERVGAPIFKALSAHRLSQVLSRGAIPGHADRAAKLAEDAASVAIELGVAHLMPPG